MDPQVANQPIIPPASKNSKVTIVSVAIFVILSLSAVAFLWYQNQQLKKMILDYQVQIQPTPNQNQKTSENYLYLDKAGMYQFEYQDVANCGELPIKIDDSISSQGVNIYCGPDTSLLQIISGTSDKDLLSWWYSLLGGNKEFFEKFGKSSKVMFANKNSIQLNFDKSVNENMNHKIILTSHNGTNYQITSYHGNGSDGWEAGVENQILSTFKFLGVEDPTAGWNTFSHKSGYSLKYPDTIKIIKTELGAPDPTPLNEYLDILFSSQTGFDKPHLRIIRLANDFSDAGLPLNQLAQKYYQKNLDLQAMPATSIQAPKQGLFMNQNSISYILKNKGYSSIVDGYLGYNGNYHTVWIEKDGYKYMIYWTEDALIDQMVSTLKFIN